MTCDEFHSLIDSMLDGELSVESIALVNSHADTCQSCGSYRERVARLHERMTVLAEKLEVPDLLEESIKKVLSDEVKRSRKSTLFEFWEYFKLPQLTATAAVLSLILARYYFYSSNKSNVLSGQTPTQKQQSKNTPQLLVSAGDLVDHTHYHLISGFHYSPSQIPALFKQFGFDIKPPVIAGFRLGDVCVCSVGKDGQPVVHMTYVSTRKQLAPQTLTCYQILEGRFDSTGMKRDETSKDSSKQVWISELNNLAVAFVDKRELEYIFVGAMPGRVIASIANHS